MAMGELSKLKQRLYLDYNGKALPPPPDADQWQMLEVWFNNSNKGSQTVWKDIRY